MEDEDIISLLRIVVSPRNAQDRRGSYIDGAVGEAYCRILAPIYGYTVLNSRSVGHDAVFLKGSERLVDIKGRKPDTMNNELVQIELRQKSGLNGWGRTGINANNHEFRFIFNDLSVIAVTRIALNTFTAGIDTENFTKDKNEAMAVGMCYNRQDHERLSYIPEFKIKEISYETWVPDIELFKRIEKLAWGNL